MCARVILTGTHLTGNIMSFIERAERYFEFQSLATNWKTEILAGFTTFVTMAYIVFVNPAILPKPGCP